MNSPASTAARKPLVVVFGATGDLMHRMLLPALFTIVRDKFHPGFAVLGVARHQDVTDQTFRETAVASLTATQDPKFDPVAVRGWAAARLFYQPVAGGDAQAYSALGRRVETLEEERGLSGDRVIYLALPASAYVPTLNGLGAAGLNRSPNGWTRLVVEKPFGEDLPSAKALNAKVHQYFDESQVYRIDHYLGKETVQNLLVFRFSNVLFESVWNRDRIERVEITVAEQLGVEHRAEYYDRTGQVRDMIQNHLTQLLALTAMEVPSAFTASAIHDEKVKVLRSVRPIRTTDAVFGQYGPGEIGGSPVPGYRSEAGVRPDSPTETFASIQLEIDNWRWHGVPFTLRAGKRLARRVSQILVQFRRPPVAFFQPFLEESIPPNELLITVQPNEGFDLVFEVKTPGQAVQLRTERMHFRYSEAFASLPGAYETLLVDVLEGDATLFVRDDEVEASWRLYDPLLQHPPPLVNYPAGSWGPEAGAGSFSVPPEPRSASSAATS